MYNTLIHIIMRNVIVVILAIVCVSMTSKYSHEALVVDNLYFDKFEVTNRAWTKFEAELLKEGKDVSLYHQTDVWTKAPMYNELYYGHDAYDWYP